MEGLWIFLGVALSIVASVWGLKTVKARRCRAAAIEARK